MPSPLQPTSSSQCESLLDPFCCSCHRRAHRSRRHRICGGAARSSCGSHHVAAQGLASLVRLLAVVPKCLLRARPLAPIGAGSAAGVAGSSPRGHGSGIQARRQPYSGHPSCGENGAREGKRMGGGSCYGGLCWALQQATATTRQRAAAAAGGPACLGCGGSGGCRPPSRLRETTRGSPYMLFFRLVWIRDK